MHPLDAKAGGTPSISEKNLNSIVVNKITPFILESIVFQALPMKEPLKYKSVETNSQWNHSF